MPDRRMPWMNGGGETIEIAVSPEGAGLASFDWRVSMARVTQPGPFSSFTGVDRTLAILDGAGLTVAVAGRHPVELTAASPSSVLSRRSACHGDTGRRPGARPQCR